MIKQVEKIKEINSLWEIGQQNPTEFCLVRYDERVGKLVQCHQFVHCRDFLGDVMVHAEDGREVSIYNFKFGKANPQPDPENCSMLVKLHSKQELDNMMENFPILKGIEDVLGWGTTFPDLVDFPGEKFIVWCCGDARWQRTAPAFALYSYLLKCLTYKFKDKTKWMEEIKAMKTNEGNYMADLNYMKWLLVNLDTLSTMYKTFSGFKDQKKIAIHILHNYTGFIGIRNLIQNGKASTLHHDHVLENFSDYYKKAA